MSILFNREKNLKFELSPICKDEFGFLCHISLHTELITINYNNVSINDRYISYKNLDYIKKNIIKFNNMDSFQEESEVIFDIYPIDMFMMLDVFKSNNSTLWVELKLPTSIFTNGSVAGYFITFSFWVDLDVFCEFILSFIDECDMM